MLIPKTLRFNTFLLVMDELDLDAQFVQQFEDLNFMLLEKFIFSGDSFRFNRQLFLKNRNFRVHRSRVKRYGNQITCLYLRYKKVTGVSVSEILIVFHSVPMRYEVPLPSKKFVRVQLPYL